MATFRDLSQYLAARNCWISRRKDWMSSISFESETGPNGDPKEHCCPSTRGRSSHPKGVDIPRPQHSRTVPLLLSIRLARISDLTNPKSPGRKLSQCRILNHREAATAFPEPSGTTTGPTVRWIFPNLRETLSSTRRFPTAKG